MIVALKKPNNKTLVRRTRYLKSLGFECKNWRWSWSFVNHEKRIVAFGALDYETNGNRTRILAEEWKIHPDTQLMRRAYRQATEHINLIQKQGYEFQMFRQFGALNSDGSESLIGVEPGLHRAELIPYGHDWFGVWDQKDVGMPQRTYGHIDGVPVGATFPSRVALSQAGIHRATVAGITGGADGSESIVLNEGYVDDEDHGDVVIYTGHGGQDSNTRRQVQDQELKVGNKGLVVCREQGFPVRVCRGPKLQSAFRPDGVYRYDGLYRVEDCWHDRGQDGHKIYRFRLVAIPGESTNFGNQIHDEPDPMRPTGSAGPALRVPVTTNRIVRDPELAQHVKKSHKYRCQICDVQLPVPSGFYAEAAHIKALGAPHNGDDRIGNLLCLCPNHHVLFDRGSIWIDANMNVQPDGVPLLRQNICPVDQECTEYHRKTRSGET